MSKPTLVSVTGTIEPTDTTENSVPQMAKMPWYPRDFASATRGWPLVARGAYRELLDAQWDMGSLPEDASELQAIVAATPKEWSASWPRLESKFPTGEDGRRRNPRLEIHRRKAIELFKSQSAGGTAACRKRWGNR